MLKGDCKDKVRKLSLKHVCQGPEVNIKRFSFLPLNCYACFKLPLKLEFNVNYY